MTSTILEEVENKRKYHLNDGERIYEKLYEFKRNDTSVINLKLILMAIGKRKYNTELNEIDVKKIKNVFDAYQEKMNKQNSLNSPKENSTIEGNKPLEIQTRTIIIELASSEGRGDDGNGDIDDDDDDEEEFGPTTTKRIRPNTAILNDDENNLSSSVRSSLSSSSSSSLTSTPSTFIFRSASNSSIPLLSTLSSSSSSSSSPSPSPPLSSNNSTMSVIHYETEVRQAESSPVIDLTRNVDDPDLDRAIDRNDPNSGSKIAGANTLLSLSSADRKEQDSLLVNRFQKTDNNNTSINKKCINLLVLEWRYVFIDRIEGTPFFYCFDIKDFKQFYCKVSNHSCSKLIEAYNRLKDQSNINQLHKVIRLDKKTYLLFPRPQDDMLSYLRHKKSLPEDEARSLFRQMCDIVKSCHEKGVVLRDLKLRKFVFNDTEKKHIQLESLVDAIVLKDPESDLIQEKRGCPLYVAPEVLKTNRSYNGKPADMWSLGVILYTMLLGRYPFNEEEHSHLFMKITNGKFFIPNNISPKARCLIRSLLQQEPRNRLTSEDVFYHPWMTASNDTEIYEPTKTDQCVPDNDYFNILINNNNDKK